MVHSVETLPVPGQVVTLAVADLTICSSFRESGVNDEHVQRLLELDGHWPPILVNRADRVVIDGAHRVVAARLLGLKRVEAWYFDGGSEDALIEFVRRNVHQGLPLTLRERKRAVEQVLKTHPEWSDRRIAELCAISPKTVGRLRPKGKTVADGGIHPLEERTRIGRDNKWRPVHDASLRARVAEAIRQRPDASLRQVAKLVGASPETVRIVRMNLDTVPGPDEASRRPAAIADSGTNDHPGPWKHDLALVSSDHGDDFVAWFDRTTLTGEECSDFIELVPLSRIYEIADEARRRSEVWLQFAKCLDLRSSKRK
jgi:ParB-like chromosome segregation protein Spo0J